MCCIKVVTVYNLHEINTDYLNANKNVSMIINTFRITRAANDDQCDNDAIQLLEVGTDCGTKHSSLIHGMSVDDQQASGRMSQTTM